MVFRPAHVRQAFVVLAPSWRRVGIFEDAVAGEGVDPTERVTLTVAEVAVGDELCFVAMTPSPDASVSEIDDAAMTLGGGRHIVVLTPWTEHPMWKDSDMPARLICRGSSASPAVGAASAVALVLATWGWDDREAIPVAIDGRRIVVQMCFEGGWSCAIDETPPRS